MWFLQRWNELIYSKLYFLSLLHVDLYSFSPVFRIKTILFHFKFRWNILNGSIVITYCYHLIRFSIACICDSVFLYKNLILNINNLRRMLFYKFPLAWILCNHLENTNNQKNPKIFNSKFKLPFFIPLNLSIDWHLNFSFGIMDLNFPWLTE